MMSKVNLFSFRFQPRKSIIFFAVVVEDDNLKMSNGMGSKSMDSINSYDGSRNALEDQEQGDDVEKARLISNVLELQNTLDDLNQRVDGVKEENLRLRSENCVLGQYIGESLISDDPKRSHVIVFTFRKSHVRLFSIFLN